MNVLRQKKGRRCESPVHKRTSLSINAPETRLGSFRFVFNVTGIFIERPTASIRLAMHLHLLCLRLLLVDPFQNSSVHWQSMRNVVFRVLSISSPRYKSFVRIFAMASKILESWVIVMSHFVGGSLEYTKMRPSGWISSAVGSRFVFDTNNTR